MAGVGFLNSLWEKPIWGGVWPHLDPTDSVFLRTASMEWNVPGKCGPHGELFFLPDSQGRCRTVIPSVPSSMLTSAPPSSLLMSSRSALLGTHLMAEEGREDDGCHVLGLGDEWKMGCPKSPMRESEGEARSEDESVSSTGSREGNVCNDALHVIGLYGPGDKIFLFLQDWGLGHAVPGNEWALVAGLLLPKGPSVTARRAFLSPWTCCAVRE